MQLMDMAIISLSIILFMILFSYWAGGKIQEKHSSFPDGHIVKFDQVYSAYRKGDPYQFIYRTLKLTKLRISETELLIIGRGQISSFITHMMGISNKIKVSELKVEKASENVIELIFIENGFEHTLCIRGSETNEILRHLNS